MSDLERLGLKGVAFLVVAGVLVGLSETPLYPLALGILIVALFAVLLTPSGSSAISQLNKTIQSFGGQNG